MGWGGGGWGGGVLSEDFRVGSQTLSLDPSVTGQGQGGFVVNVGNAPASYELNLSSPDATPKITEILMAMRSSNGQVGGKFLTGLVNTTSWARLDATARGWAVAHFNDTAAIDDSANGGVGSGARILGTSTNVGVMLKRVRISRDTLLDSLRGWEREFLRLRATASSAWETQLRWSASLADPASQSNAVVPHELAAGGSSGYGELDLGYIRIPEQGALGGVALELWARRISGTGDLHMNLIRNLPATPGKDVLTRIAVPGGSTRVYDPWDLVVPTSPAALVAGEDVTVSSGDVNGRAHQLDQVSEAGAPPPVAGEVLSPGHYRVLFYVQRFTASGGSITWEYRVRNVTDGNYAAQHSVTDVNIWPGSDYDPFLLEFTAVSGKAYQAQIAVTALGGGGGAVRIFEHNPLSMTYLPVLTQNEQAHTNPASGIVHKRDSSGNLVGNLSTEGEVPFYVPPGLAAVFAVPLDVPRAGYTESESVKARTVTVTATGAPRFTG